MASELKEIKENANLSCKTYLVKRSNLPAHPDAPKEEASTQVEMLLLGLCELPSEGAPVPGVI